MKKKAVVISILILLIAVMAFVVVKFLMPVIRLADDPDEFRGFIESRGVWGIALFMIINALQVIVAVIPAGPLEVAAGYCFGPVKGAIISDLGMVIGSMTVFCLVKQFGMPLIEVFFSEEKTESLKFLRNGKNTKLIVFLLYLIPGAPKDLLTYGVGLTNISAFSMLFIAAVGRFPTILLTCMGGDVLEEKRYGAFIAVIAVIAVLSLTGAFIYRRLSGNKASEAEQTG